MTATSGFYIKAMCKSYYTKKNCGSISVISELFQTGFILYSISQTSNPGKGLVRFLFQIG